MSSFSPRGICTGIALLVLAQPALAGAQTRLTAGYQYQRDSTSLGSNDYPLGLGITAEHAIARSAWSLVADVATSSTTTEGTYPSTLLSGIPPQGRVQATNRRTSLAAGLRWTGGTNGFHPHAQALFGAVRGSASANVIGSAGTTTSTENEPLLQIGGGVTQPIAGRFAVLGQVDYRRVFGGSESPLNASVANLVRDANEVRVLVGVQIAVRR